MFLLVSYFLVVILILCAILAIWQYVLYKKLYIVRLPNTKEKRQQLKRDRDLRFFQYIRIFTVTFVLVIFITIFIGIRTLIDTKQLDLMTAKVGVLEKEVRDLKSMKSNTTNESTSNEPAPSVSVENYRSQAWHISDFAWAALVPKEGEEGGTTGEKSDYETQLAEKLKPFVGDCMVTITQNHSEPTINVFVLSLGLSTNAFQMAQENVYAMAEDLNTVSEISVIDFSFSYGDNGNTQKKPFMFYRDGAELKEVKKTE